MTLYYSHTLYIIHIYIVKPRTLICVILPIATTDKVPYLHTNITIIRWLILLISTGCSFGVKAQYQSFFGDSSTFWTSVGSFQRINEWTDSIVIVKDTLIQGTNYKKAIGWRAFPDNYYVGEIFFREDTTSGKLWALQLPASERLIADMSLKVGDQFIEPGTNAIVLTVDSVYYLNQRKHIRISTSYSIVPYEVIEGVGPTYVYPYSGVLLCQHKDGTSNFLLTTTEYPGVCNVALLNKVASHFPTEQHIYPNPTNGKIKELAEKSGAFRLFDLAGREVFSRSVISGKELQFDITHLSDGVLIYTFTNQDNQIYKREQLVLQK